MYAPARRRALHRARAQAGCSGRQESGLKGGRPVARRVTMCSPTQHAVPSAALMRSKHTEEAGTGPGLRWRRGEPLHDGRSFDDGRVGPRRRPRRRAAKARAARLRTATVEGLATDEESASGVSTRRTLSNEIPCDGVPLPAMPSSTIKVECGPAFYEEIEDPAKRTHTRIDLFKRIFRGRKGIPRVSAAQDTGQ